MHKELKQLETKDMGMRLRKVREERKMTRETLAEKVDLSVNFIADVEYGNKSPSIRKLYSLIQALDTNADYILGGNMREIDIDEEAAEKINRAKENGHKVICVGTTSCRTIESAADENGKLKACSGWTEIFIYPGYQFKVLDELITNFHLPESTLVMLVSALAGREHVLAAYEEAVKERYRFFSFGDAMFIKD